MDALNLNMPRKVPRTEYSASSYWSLVSAVTGIAVTPESDWETKSRASMSFEKAWDFGFTWSAAYAEGRSRYEPQHTVPV